jgi:acyl carrier protein
MQINVLERVQTIIARELKLTEVLVEPHAHLVNDLDTNSMNVVSLMLALEEEFGMDFPFLAVNRMNTAAELSELITNRILLLL